MLGNPFFRMGRKSGKSKKILNPKLFSLLLRYDIGGAKEPGTLQLDSLIAS